MLVPIIKGPNWRRHKVGTSFTVLSLSFLPAMVLLWMLLQLLGSSTGNKMFKDLKLAPSFFSTLGSGPAKYEVEDNRSSFDTDTMLNEFAEEEELEDSLEGETEEDMMQSIQNEKMKPMQGSWNWNPIDMTLSWSIKRPLGGTSDRYTMAVKHEGIERETAESEESELEDSDYDEIESEELSGPLTGSN